MILRPNESATPWATSLPSVPISRVIAIATIRYPANHVCYASSSNLLLRRRASARRRFHRHRDAAVSEIDEASKHNGEHNRTHQGAHVAVAKRNRVPDEIDDEHHDARNEHRF